MNFSTESPNTTDNITSGPDASAVSSASEKEDPTLTLYSTIVNVYIDGLLCLFGFFGNLMTILILQRQGVRTSNAVLLQALAVFDSCFLIYTILYVVLRTAGVMTGVNEYIVAIVLPFGWTTQTATIWTAMAIVIDRFLIVSRPLKAIQWCTVKHARVVVICISTAAVLFNAVRWPRYYFMSFENKGQQHNTTFVSHLSASIENWDEDTYMKVYHISLTFVFIFLIPLSIIVTLNIGLIYHLMKATKHRKQLTGGKAEKEQDKKTKTSLNVSRMVAVLITIFIVCELPDFIAAIIGAGQFKKDPATYQYFAVFKEFMIILNSSINFYIYIIFYKRFRKELKSIFCYRGTKQNNNNSTADSMATSVTNQMSVSHVETQQATVKGVAFTPI